MPGRVVTDVSQVSLVPGQTTDSTYDGTGALRVTGTVQAAAAYRGGTIVVANASQPLMAVNPNRQGFTVQNQSTGDLYIKIGGAAATTGNASLRIAPGQLYETPPHHTSTGAVAIAGATVGAAFFATEF